MFDVLLLLRIGAALVGTGAAAWEDARTSFIDDRTTVSMIILGAVLCAFDVFNAFTAGADLTPWLWVAVVAAAIALLGFFAWRAGQFGGGDVLLFLGLHLLLPFNPGGVLGGVFGAASGAAALPYPFIVSVLVAASFLGCVWSTVWYAKRLAEKKALERIKTGAVLVGAFAAAAVLAYYSFSVAQIVFFSALLASAFFLSLFKRDIMARVVTKRISLAAVENEDVLALDEIPKRLVAKYGIGRVLTEREIAKLRRIERLERKGAGIGKKGGKRVWLWPVYKELPRFAPFVFLGLAACLLLGDVVLFVLTH